MSNKVTWAQFESLSSNIQDDFERLSRLFFKYRYVKDANALLPKCFNNPGIETEPILIDGLKVGFQAKYFAGRILSPHSQISPSGAMLSISTFIFSVLTTAPPPRKKGFSFRRYPFPFPLPTPWPLP